MRWGSKSGLWTCVSALALSSPAHAQELPGSPTTTGASSNVPAGTARIVQFTVPLVTENRAFGEILIETTANGDRVSLRTDDLVRELSELLNENGRTALVATIGGREYVTPGDLSGAGFSLEFDSGQLELVVKAIDPKYRQTQQLIGRPSGGTRDTLPVVAPAGFSTYLNVIGNVDYDTQFSGITPDVFLSGATRVGNVVAEYDGAFSDQFGEGYRFLRRNTRVVYDDPKSFRRYSAGDLRLEALSIMAVPQIGGIGIEKRRRIFDTSSSAARLSGRQIFLDNRSTVEVRVDGEVYETLQLDAGQYDLSNLPIQQGRNDIELVIIDSFGQRQVIPFDLFYENLSLSPGEEEYSLGVGFLSKNFGFEPVYSNEVGASGLYRRALSENLVLGAALQLSEKVQVVGGSLISVPQFVTGVVEAEAAASNVRDGGTGVAVRVGYRFASGQGIYGSDQFAFSFDYKSANFRSLTEPVQAGFDLLSATAAYSKALGLETLATVGASYFKSGGSFPDNYSLFADVSHRLSQTIRATVGVEYGRGSTFQRGFGVRLGLTAALGPRTRASADYRSRLNSFRANLSRGAENHVGSFGYDVGVTRIDDDTQASLQLEYQANRFRTRADFSSGGGSLSKLFDEQRARLQIATSFAFAGGQFGIGRPVNSAFLLAKPDSAIKNQEIVTGRAIRSGNYYARSGVLGSALQGDLAAYSRQNIDFDAADPDRPFDVGDGTVLVHPPYKGGYSVLAGNANYVSAIGTLIDANGPVKTAVGEVVDATTGEPVEGLQFFTNSAGRFGLFGLAPGKRYAIRLRNSDRTFAIEIPANSEAIIRLAPIAIPAE